MAAWSREGIYNYYFVDSEFYCSFIIILTYIVLYCIIVVIVV